MDNEFSVIKYPELVFGIAGPIGIDIDAISQAISDSLHTVGYKAVNIRLTAEIEGVESSVKLPKRTDYYTTIKYNMDHVSAICRDNNDAARGMRYVIDAIIRERSVFLDGDESGDPDPSDVSLERIEREASAFHRTAYIVRQIKRPEEVELLRNVYGDQFFLISAYGNEADRIRIIQQKIKSSLPLTTKVSKIISLAEKLVIRDMSEDGDLHGQHLRDAFHLTDVFLDGLSNTSIKSNIERFINALFGLNEIAPTKVELGMYSAKSASLRSSDLSRQVGAALFTYDGEIVAQGCNEVPKALGGNYWDTEEPDYRDIKLGSDPNDYLKKEVLRDVLERLQSKGMLSAKAISLGASDGKLIDRLIKSPKLESDDGAGCLEGSLILDITEYGRVVHAEMNSICEAARLGRPTKNTVLFCTTFPCHNCSKHILAAGVGRVYFMEPYPKSKAKELHFNEIELETVSLNKVSFLPFFGISPNRYRDIFSKKKRKKDGAANKWYFDDPAPMIDILVPNYTQLELFAIAPLIGEIESDVGES